MSGGHFLTSRAVGWVIVGISLILLGNKIFRKKSESAPAAEVRKMYREPTSAGAWWFTGAPGPANQPADFTGVWLGGTLPDISKAALPGHEVILTPYGKRRYDTVDHSQNPTNHCLPPGPVRMVNMQGPVMIVQRPDVVLFLTEYQRTYRIVYTDGRGHDPDAKDYPEWMGSSIGTWDKDTLLVDTTAINDRSWMDIDGHEHSDQLRMSEAFRLLDQNTLEHLTTLEDPVFFEKPFTIRRLLKRQIGDRILDHSCLENEKDIQNLVPTIGGAGR